MVFNEAGSYLAETSSMLRLRGRIMRGTRAFKANRTSTFKVSLVYSLFCSDVDRTKCVATFQSIIRLRLIDMWLDTSVHFCHQLTREAVIFDFLAIKCSTMIDD